VITIRTGVAGKSHRGRIYVVGFSVNLTDENRNVVSTSGLGTMNTVCDALMAEFGDADGTNEVLALGIYSKLIGGAFPYTLAGWQAASQLVPRRVIGSQRRRRIGIGM
jgi:hypothetical protein